MENNQIGATIGNLSSIDFNNGDNHTYALVVNASYAGKFRIVGPELLATTRFDFETDSRRYPVLLFQFTLACVDH